MLITVPRESKRIFRFSSSFLCLLRQVRADDVGNFSIIISLDSIELKLFLSFAWRESEREKKNSPRSCYHPAFLSNFRSLKHFFAAPAVPLEDFGNEKKTFSPSSSLSII
jgi:hypothetical protein